MIGAIYFGQMYFAGSLGNDTRFVRYLKSKRSNASYGKLEKPTAVWDKNEKNTAVWEKGEKPSGSFVKIPKPTPISEYKKIKGYRNTN